MKTVKKTLLTLAVLSVPVTAMAMPSLRDDCQFSSPIQSGGADILFSQNCKTAYVAPPNTGKVTLSGYHETQGTYGLSIYPHATPLFSIYRLKVRLRCPYI